MEILNSIEKNYDIKSSEVDFNNNLKPNALLSLMEDIAYISAENLGFGYSNVYDRGLAWFVVRYRVRLEEKIKAWDVIKIKTWPVKSAGITCRRDFEIFKENIKIGTATSAWATVDINRRRPVNPFKALDFPELSEHHALEISFDNIIEPENFDIEKEFNISYDALDLNGHVNNSNYISWAISTMPYDFIESHALVGFDIDYKKEATRENSKIVVKTKVENNETLHLVYADNDIECAVIKAYWE